MLKTTLIKSPSLLLLASININQTFFLNIDEIKQECDQVFNF